MKLNQYSTILLQHIKTAPDFKNHPKLSKQSKGLLKTILRHIIRGDKQFHDIRIETREHPHFKSGDLYNSIPKQIKTIMENQPFFKQESYQFSIAERKIEVHFLIPSSYPRGYIKTALKLIYTWLYVASQYTSDDKCASSLQLYLYLIPHYKILPKTSDEPIEEIHANTGFTWACVENSTIQIFREEEWFKVLIHETFHTFGLDFAKMDISNCKRKIRELFSIETEGLLFESYCETWATIIHSLFLSFYKNDPRAFPLPHPDYIKQLLIIAENILYIETKYAIFQSIKVLKHYNLSYNDLLHQTTETKKRRTQYYEKTNVFCYNVLKALMLYYSDDFLLWCIKHNHGLLDFHKTKSTIENFCNWIEKHHKTNEYIEDYNKIEDWYMAFADNSDNYIFKSMRLTIFG
jgi:hypothetical protein